jgi:hypothetical protein
MMKRETKKAGRRANKDDRFVAEVLVNVYRKALATQDKRLTLIDEKNPQDQCVVDGSDIRPLLALLDNFAKHGTFKSAKIPLLEDIEIRMQFNELRRSGLTYAKAAQQLAEEKNVSVSTIERKIKKVDTPGVLSMLAKIG